MHIGWSELDRKGNLIGYKLEVDGIPVAFDALTLELLEELLQDADGISIFGDDGDIQPEIEEVAEQFFVTISVHEDWQDGEVRPFTKGLGAFISKTKSSTIRGKENILELISRFGVLLKKE
mgnify:CR=1 FL=1